MGVRSGHGWSPRWSWPENPDVELELELELELQISMVHQVCTFVMCMHTVTALEYQRQAL